MGFIVWSYLWLLSGVVLPSDFGWISLDFGLAIELITLCVHEDSDFVIFMICAMLPLLIWLFTFRVYTLSVFEQELYDIKI